MIFLLLLATVFIKQILWWAIVPIWHTPDEQAHFAQLQYYAEKKTLNIDPKNNLSEEVAVSEELLGTRRDERGNNKFTYHPEYKNNAQVPAMPISSRTVYVGSEAAGYPPLYYLISLPFYYLFYNFGLIDRVYAVRFVSVILNILLVLVAYATGKQIWKNKNNAVILAALVAFQPMVSFVGAGVHPDNLLNLLTSLAILVDILILENGVKIKYLAWLGVLIWLGMQTKPFMIFMIPILLVPVFIKYWPLVMVILVSPVAAFVYQLKIPMMPGVTPQSPLYSMNFLDYLKFRIPKLMFEMWPWFWGVFKWLGVVFPPLILKIITRVAIISGAGLILKILLRRKDNFEFKVIYFFLLTTVVYIIYLFVWDWRLMQSMGWSQGLQGRYLFVNIIPMMALLMIGVMHWRESLGKVLVFLEILLNIAGLWIIAKSYYLF